MIALYQSHVYSEYLPKIIGDQKMQAFGLAQSGRSSKFGSVRIDITHENVGNVYFHGQCLFEQSHKFCWPTHRP